jgi:hypothetical protein
MNNAVCQNYCQPTWKFVTHAMHNDNTCDASRTHAAAHQDKTHTCYFVRTRMHAQGANDFATVVLLSAMKRMLMHTHLAAGSL